ncbi:MAG: nucleotidyltransferase family protein [Kiloniellaceae bacterium]
MGSSGDAYLDRVRRIVLDALAGYAVKVYLFGSRASGPARRTSDVDVAVDPHEPLPPRVLADLREALEESTIPYFVDVVDLSTVDADFRRHVLSEAVPWKD